MKNIKNYEKLVEKAYWILHQENFEPVLEEIRTWSWYSEHYGASSVIEQIVLHKICDKIRKMKTIEK